MADLGVLASDFEQHSLEGTLDSIVSTGATSVQFDLACAAGTSFPLQIDEALCTRVRGEFSKRNLRMAAVSGFYNMAHPEPAERQAGLQNLERLVSAAPALGTNVVCICTGSRNKESMWAQHPENDSSEAWSDLVAGVRQAARTAERHGVLVGFEPEVNNVVSSARKARQLMDEIGSSHLKVVFDGANIFKTGDLSRMHEVLDEAFSVLSDVIVLGHAKDLDHDGDAGHLPPGKGVLDFEYLLRRLKRTGFDGSIILHPLAAAEARNHFEFIRRAAPAGYLTK